ncbi:MAG: carbohydrate ABC transporter permease [Salinibacterium sp.]|nr:carbohydrate ABC transporter permease [Salinibacterium sp.]
MATTAHVELARQTGEASVSSGEPAVRHRRSRWRSRLNTASFHTVAITLSVIWFFPIFMVLITSFRTNSDVLRNGVAAWPEAFVLDAFWDAWVNAEMGRALLNSLIITIPVVLLTLLLSSFAAFALSRYRIRFRRTLLLLMLAGNLLPAQLMLIPWQKAAEGAGLYDTFLIVILIQTAAGLGFYTFVMYGFMRAIPFELQDAAAIDGAGPLRTYWQIIMPLTRPALAALGALAFTWIFNDLLLSITLLRTSSQFPITAAVLSLIGEYSAEWNLIAAATIIAAIPCVIVFLMFQKQFVGGLALGAVK